jgi:peroxiredoxin
MKYLHLASCNIIPNTYNDTNKNFLRDIMKTIIYLSLFFLLLVTNIKIAEANSCPLLNGETIDGSILVQTLKEKMVPLKQLTSKMPTILVFYRGGWCPFCNRQLAGLRKITKDITKLGYQLIAISPDRVSKFKESITKHKLDYQLLSDSNLDLANSFGLSFKLDAKTLEKYEKFGINVEEASGKKHHSLPMPAVYVLDTKGLIHFSYVNPNYKVRLNEKVLLTALQELKLK